MLPALVADWLIITLTFQQVQLINEIKLGDKEMEMVSEASLVPPTYVANYH